MEGFIFAIPEPYFVSPTLLGEYCQRYLPGDGAAKTTADTGILRGAVITV
jgi:hypothetical protein